jgi:uncharacterized protein
MKDELIELNPWWEGKSIKKVINRPYYTEQILNRKDKIIDVLTGARRVGKTFILYDLINLLIKSGLKPHKILYVSAELPKIAKLSITNIVNDYYKARSIKATEKTYIFIDEIQEIENWQLEIKYLYDHKKIKFFLTGSSGLVLGKETAKLTGRFINTHIFPLSFREYIEFKKIKATKVNYRLAQKYLDNGGYPEQVLKKNDSLLIQTAESIMFRDLLSHYGIRNPAILKDLLQLLCDKVTSVVSANTVAKNLKVDVQTAQFYLKYLQDVYLIYPLFRQGRSHKIVKGFAPKYYLNDTGLLRLYSRTRRVGQLAENAVFLELKRRSFLNNQELYYDIVQGSEIDFVYQDHSFDVKMKPLEENANIDTTYIVKKEDKNLGFKQIELHNFLYSN